MPAIRTKVLSSMEKVFQSEEPAELCIPLNALQGETIAFQLAVFPELGEPSASYSHLDVEVEILSSIPIHARQVGYVPCELLYFDNSDHYYLKDSPGLFPDPLLSEEDGRFRLLTGRWNSLFLEAFTDTAAGRYPITIRINPRQGAYEPAEETVYLDIIGTRLLPSDFEYTNWFHGDCIADYYGIPVFSEQHWAAMENQMRLAAAYGQTMILTPLFTPPLDTAVGWERTTIQLIRVFRTSDSGSYSFDFSLLDRFIATAKRSGLRSFEMSHLFTQWGGKACPKILCEESCGSRKLFGWETEALSPSYCSFLSTFLPLLVRHLDALQLRSHVVFHLTDEPQGEDLQHYRKLKQFVEPLLDGYPIMDAISEYAFFAEGVSSRPVVVTSSAEPFLKGPRPDPFWVYYCCNPGNDCYANRFIDMPGSRTRIIGLQCYLEHVNGFLQWGLNFYNSQYSLKHIDPYCTTDAERSFPSGDSFIIYPGKNGEAVPSQRLVLIGEAWRDYAALKMLESLSSAAHVREIVMQTARKHGYTESTITFRSYPRDNEFLPDLRRQINLSIAQFV